MSSRVYQYIGLLAIFGLMAGGYWYWEARGALKANAPQYNFMTTNLLGYWSFDGGDTTSTTATDRGSGGNNGTLTGSPTKVQGRFGQALSFNGTTGYVDMGDINALDGIGAMTLSAWINPTVVGDLKALLAKSDTSTGWNLQTMNGTFGSSNDIIFAPDAAGYCYTTKHPLAAGTWLFVTAVFDGSLSGNANRAKIYVNGDLQPTTCTGAIPATTPSTTHTVRVGALSNGVRFLNSVIDEPRIYTSALSDGQIQSLYRLGNGSKVSSSFSNPQGTGRLDSGLSAYFKLDENTGTTTTDASTNGATGTLTNGPTWTTGQISYGVDFDGTDDYITTPDAAVLDVTDSTNFTLSGWFNRDTFTTDDTIVAKSNGQTAADTGYNAYIDDATDKLTFVAQDGTDQYKLESVSTFTATGWHHFVISWNDNSSTETKLSIDGVAEAVTATGTFANVNDMSNAVEFRIGAESDAGSPFDGKLDEVRLYNWALSPTETDQLYRLNSPTGVDTGLKGYWSFNGADVAGTTAYDRSGAGNNGALTNSPTRIDGKVGQALSFDGTDDYISLSTLTSTSQNYTFAFWVNRDTGASGQNYIFDSQSGRLIIDLGSNAPTANALSFYDGSWKSIGSAISTSTWHHIVLSLNSATSTATGYLDGVQIGTAAYTGINIGGTTNIGASFGVDTNFKGSLDEFRLYNRVLSASEIQAQYAQGGGSKTNTSISTPQGAGRLDSGLHAYFKLDENTGTNTTDASTNGATGALTNGPTWTTGQFGSAVNFDGTNDYITIPDSNEYSFTNGSGTDRAFSVSAWVKIETAANFRIVSKTNNTSSTAEWQFGTNGTGFLIFYLYHGGTSVNSITRTADTSVSGDLNNWIYLTATYNGSESGTGMKLYRNGVEIASTAGLNGSYSGMSNTAAPLVLGAVWPADGIWKTFADGSIDEARVYNRELSSDEVSQLYGLTAPTGVDTGLKGYWSFNGADVAGTTAFDRSGAGNNGTLTNSPTKDTGRLGQALNFDGTDDHVTMGDPASLDLSGARTISAWIYPESSGGNSLGRIVDKNSGATNGYMFYFQGVSVTNGLTYSIGNGSAGNAVTTLGNDIALNQWQHVVVTCDPATDAIIYVNGVSVTLTGSVTSCGAAVSDNFVIGGRTTDNTRNFDGKIDEVRIYDRVLSADEVWSLYNQGR